jgi:tRNA pseudouridine55 synthase
MLLLIDKPQGITSHDVVDRVRRITGERRVGHAGTLDPMATGLLIVGVGRESTKLLGNLTTGTSKEYIATLRLGSETDTLDAEGKVTKTCETPPLDEDLVNQALLSFLGESMQEPPVYSAIKLSGKKAYELARQGESPKMQERKITIYSIELIRIKGGDIEFKVSVSAGTYIRSLGRDISVKLGSCGHLVSLRRTKIGDYSIENAKTLEELKASNIKGTNE